MFKIAGSSFVCQSALGSVRGYARRRSRAVKVRKSVRRCSSNEIIKAFPAQERPPPKSNLVRNISYGIIPLVLAITGFIFSQMEPNDRPEFLSEYTRLRNKWFSWGDGQSSLSDNPQLNMLSTEGHEGECEEKEEGSKEVSTEQHDEKAIFNDESERKPLTLKLYETTSPAQ